MTLELSTYKNSKEIANLNGVSIYLNDLMEAALRAKLNVFLQGDTGSGKTQLASDIMNYFGEKSLFILGRNDMDTRELFQQINPGFIKALKEGRETTEKFKEVSDKVKYHCIVVDELPNCVSGVRAQLFNVFDGFIEIDGRRYAFGSNYNIGIATGNIGQQFTESSNELGRALKDRMHIIFDVDYFRPEPIDTLDMLMKDRNPRVCLDQKCEDKSEQIITAYNKLSEKDVPFEKYIIAQYLIHGLDYLEGNGSKTALKSGWPNKIEGHEAGSDASLILPVSPRAAKSIIALSQALDEISEERGATATDYFSSMMLAFKFTSAYSGILNESKVMQEYNENKYAAMDAVIESTTTQFTSMKEYLAGGIYMAERKELNEKVLNHFSGRWSFMRRLLEQLVEREL